jgi:hypothetical protein
MGDRPHLLVTNSDGVLLGVVWRQEVEARAVQTAAGHRHG